jgi:hypothetical protein
MFIGHFAMGFGAKRAARGASLGTLFFAAQLVDFVWAALMLLGVEHARIIPGFTRMVPLDLYHVPYSHSLAGSLALALAFGGGYYLLRRDRKTSLVLGAVVFSHWLLDFLTHAPDLPVAPGMSTMLGLGLWNYPLASVLTEGGIFVACVWSYVSHSSARDLAGHLLFWPIPVLLAFLWLGNMTNTPPNTTVVAFSTLSMLVFIPLAAWAGRHRGESRGAGEPVSGAVPGHLQVLSKKL